MKILRYSYCSGITLQYFLVRNVILPIFVVLAALLLICTDNSIIVPNSTTNISNNFHIYTKNQRFGSGSGSVSGNVDMDPGSAKN